MPLICFFVWAHSRCERKSKAPFYYEGNQGSKIRVCDLPKVTQLVASLGGTSPLTTPRANTTPGCCLCSSPPLVAALRPGGRKGLCFIVWKNRAKAMATGCPGPESDRLMCPRLWCLLYHSWGSRLALWPLREAGAKGLLGPSEAEKRAAGASQTTHKQHLPRPPGLRAEKQCQIVLNTG